LQFGKGGSAVEAKIQKITPNFWFNMNAEEAVDFYMSVFKDGKIGRKTYYVKEGFEIHGMPEGTILTIDFQLEGQDFVALNGGDQFSFTEAVSFIINCDSQEEVDYYWDKLTEGGDEESQVCGWLKDKFGVSWQIVPVAMNDMFADPDTEKVERVMKVMLQMKKLDLAALQQAYEGR
jgi:predicted 3-demethylubiquinone-9 3-methyltransferase (glyoxalase superfamily)